MPLLVTPWSCTLHSCTVGTEHSTYSLYCRHVTRTEWASTNLIHPTQYLKGDEYLRLFLFTFTQWSLRTRRLNSWLRSRGLRAHYPSDMKHGAGWGHGRQAHDSYMTWPYFCVVTCAGRGPWGWSSPWAHCDNTWLPDPGVHNILHHQDLGPGIQKEGNQHPVYTWPRPLPAPSLTIHREATPCQLFRKCQSR